MKRDTILFRTLIHAALVILATSCGSDDEEAGDMINGYVEADGNRFNLTKAYIADLSPRGRSTKRTRLLFLTDGTWDEEEADVINYDNQIFMWFTVRDGDFFTEGRYEKIGGVHDDQEYYWVQFHANLDDGEIGHIIDTGTVDIRFENDSLFVDFNAKVFRGADDLVITGKYEGNVEVFFLD